MTFMLSGSLIEHYPNFNANLRKALRTLVGAEVESLVDIDMAKDGSGVGGMFKQRVRVPYVS